VTKVHISLLGFVFLSAFFYQPNWVYENFWSKADFYDSLLFTVPYLVFLFIYAAITTALAELGIRFIKKYV
jgi:hypothetical protein